MDIGTVSPFSSTPSPIADSNPFASTTQSGNAEAADPVAAPTGSAESLHVDLRSTQVTLSSNSNLQFAVPTNLLQSTPLYTAGMMNRLQSLQTKYANDLLDPTGLGSGSGSGNGIDINKGELTLGSFAEQELATQIGTDALQNSTVTFDNFSAQSSDTSSLTQTQTQIQATQTQDGGTTVNEADGSQSTMAFSETGAAKLSGSGHITLTNGQTIAFKAELDVSTAVTETDTVTNVSVSSATQTAPTGSNAPAPASSSTASSVTAPAPADSTSSGQAWAALIKSLSPPPAPVTAPDPNAATTDASSQKAHKKDDWNTLLSQYSNLMDIINSVKTAVDALQPVQSTGGTANSSTSATSPT